MTCQESKIDTTEMGVQAEVEALVAAILKRGPTLLDVTVSLLELVVKHELYIRKLEGEMSMATSAIKGVFAYSERNFEFIKRMIELGPEMAPLETESIIH